MPPCRNKTGKFVSCGKKKKGSRKYSKKRKEKESRSHSKKKRSSTPKSRRKHISRKVPKAPKAPMFPGGILRPGYYDRISRPPPISAPGNIPQNLCWTNKDHGSCMKRTGCRWDKMTDSCVSRGKSSREAALKLGVHGPKLPLSVCGTASGKEACDRTEGCRWSILGNVCIPKKAGDQINQPW